MKKYLKNLFLLVVIITTFGVFNLNAQTLTGKCIKVTDGDSFTIWSMGRRIQVELAGVDCPELEQEFGKEAYDFTSSLVFKKMVEINVRTYDNKGRVIARVTVEDKDASIRVLSAGMGWYDKETDKDKALGKAQKMAKKEKRGLWASPNPVAPWVFRKTQTTEEKTK
jgi:micrococcal nuclease